MDEIVARACTRKGERYYDLAKNNCENFVMWCLFDMNVSLQVKTWHGMLEESLSAMRFAGLSGFFQAAVERMFCNLGDDFITIVSKLTTTTRRISSKVSVGVAAAAGALIEIAIAVYDIHRAYKQWKGDENQPGGILIKSREEFIVEVIEIITTGGARFGLGFVGMILGQIWIPIPGLGAIVGSLVGVLLGHLAGKGFNFILRKVILAVNSSSCSSVARPLVRCSTY